MNVMEMWAREDAKHEETERRFWKLITENQNGEIFRAMSEEELVALGTEARREWSWRRTANLSDGSAGSVAKAVVREWARRSA